MHTRRAPRPTPAPITPVQPNRLESHHAPKRRQGHRPRNAFLRAGAFDAAVASVSLHYLPWAQTRAAFAEVRRVLNEGSPFLFRVNATDDYHGAGEGEELELNFFRDSGHYHSDTKRFFDESMVRAAAEGLFDVAHLEHKTIYRYQAPKRVWQCLAIAIET